MEPKMDEGLRGNEKIERYVGMLQKEPSQELLAVALTSIRRRMKEGGQFIVPVDYGEAGRLQVQIMQIDGKKWLPAFTGFEEQMKGKTQVMSTFLASIDQLLSMALTGDVEGVLLNPWNLTMKLDKNLIRIIRGESAASGSS